MAEVCKTAIVLEDFRQIYFKILVLGHKFNGQRYNVRRCVLSEIRVLDGLSALSKLATVGWFDVDAARLIQALRKYFDGRTSGTSIGASTDEIA